MEQLWNTSRQYPVLFCAVCSISSITFPVFLYIYTYVCMYEYTHTYIHTYIHTTHVFYSKSYRTYGTPLENPYAVIV